MAQSDVLRPFSRSPTPALPASDAVYLAGEFKKLEASITLLVQVVKQLDARLTAAGL